MTLYINCCPRPDSRTDQMARALLKKLGDYEELRLYDEPLVPLEAQRLAKRDALLARRAYDDDMFRYARQFAAARRIVIAAPYWDGSFPALLKIYIENIYVPGLVTCYDEAGQPVGLCKADTLYYVTTAGGPCDERFGYEYLKALAADSFGIRDVRLLKAEMLDIVGNDPQAILQKALADYGLTEET